MTPARASASTKPIGESPARAKTDAMEPMVPTPARASIEAKPREETPARATLGARSIGTTPARAIKPTKPKTSHARAGHNRDETQLRYARVGGRPVMT